MVLCDVVLCVTSLRCVCCADFEEALIDGTPVQIPCADAVSGVRQCAFCRYSTRQSEAMKQHVLLHAPPHWRCDACQQSFRML